jgi:hypothetical protein
LVNSTKQHQQHQQQQGPNNLSQLLQCLVASCPRSRRLQDGTPLLLLLLPLLLLL